MYSVPADVTNIAIITIAFNGIDKKFNNALAERLSAGDALLNSGFDAISQTFWAILISTN